MVALASFARPPRDPWTGLGFVRARLIPTVIPTTRDSGGVGFVRAPPGVLMAALASFAQLRGLSAVGLASFARPPRSRSAAILAELASFAPDEDIPSRGADPGWTVDQ